MAWLCLLILSAFLGMQLVVGEVCVYVIYSVCVVECGVCGFVGE